MCRAKQILRDIKLSEVLGTELNPLTKKVKDHIDDKLIDLVQFEMVGYPDNIFYKKGEIILFRQDLKNKRFWCSWQNYWSFLEKEIGLSHDDIQELTRCLVGEHLNCKQFTAYFSNFLYNKMVGEHLNCKQFTAKVMDVVY